MRVARDGRSKLKMEARSHSHRVLRLKRFPGFWLDSAALFDRNATRLLATLQRGLASPEHAEFAAQLARRRESFHRQSGST